MSNSTTSAPTDSDSSNLCQPTGSPPNQPQPQRRSFSQRISMERLPVRPALRSERSLSLSDVSASQQQQQQQQQPARPALRSSHPTNSTTACTTAATSNSNISSAAMMGNLRLNFMLAGVEKQQKEERLREEERHTQRVAEEAQEEELMRLALERSLTDMGTAHRQDTYASESDTSSTISPGRGRPASFSTESVTIIHSELEDDDEDKDNIGSTSMGDEEEDDDDDDDMSMFDMSPNEPASCARSERRSLHRMDGIPPAPFPEQNNNKNAATTTNNTTSTLVPSVPTIGISPPSSPPSSSVPRIGAFAAHHPAPKVKSPRTATAASAFSSSTTTTTTGMGGTAIAVDSPAASITKSPEVRAAIVKHATRPAVVIPPPPPLHKEKKKENPDHGTSSDDIKDDVMVAVSDSSDDSSIDAEDETGAMPTCPKATTTEVNTLTVNTNPWRTTAINPHDKQSFDDEPTDNPYLLGVGEWPALGEMPLEKMRPTEATHPSTMERTVLDPFGLSGSILSAKELDEIQRALEECPDDLEGIRWALRESQLSESYAALNDDDTTETQKKFNTETPPPATEYEFSSPNQEYSKEDAAAIAAALREVEEEEVVARTVREAQEEEERMSLELALQMQKEEEQWKYGGESARSALHNQGKVRTMTRAEILDYRRSTGSHQPTSGSFYPSPDLEDEDEHVAPGFRMNSSAQQQQQWNRRDQNSIVGPNCEVRTKHDTDLDGEANAHRLGLDVDDVAGIGNTSYNAFMKSMKGTKKGVAKSGTGRAGSDTDATRNGAMDPHVRSVIARAINNEIIERCNGVVKEGKEAVVYHADRGADSEGFDVAIKVFKRIQEFRGRGDYVDGDPRYGKSKFKNFSSREQLEVWAEKEFRNLMRANKAGVPVPSPLFYKENVLFMRFLGSDGRPAPQLRELDLREGSKHWTTLYIQVLEAIKRLYKAGRLVHGDLSEYNILVVPASFVENHASGVEDSKELQAVIIDFGQAVDTGHPSAVDLLKRDLDHILSFFSRKGVRTMSKDEALALLLEVN